MRDYYARIPTPSTHNNNVFIVVVAKKHPHCQKTPSLPKPPSYHGKQVPELVDRLCQRNVVHGTAHLVVLGRAMALEQVSMPPAALRRALALAPNQAKVGQRATRNAAGRILPRRMQHGRNGSTHHTPASVEASVGELGIDDVQEVDEDAVQCGVCRGAASEAQRGQEGGGGVGVVDDLGRRSLVKE